MNVYKQLKALGFL